MKSLSINRARWVFIASIAGLLTSCAAAPTPYPSPDQPTPPTNGNGGGNTAPDAPFTSSGHAGFDTWRDDFASRARAGGRDPAVVRSLLDGLQPLDLYLGGPVNTASVGIGDQAEFAKPVWEYMRTAVSASRQSTGVASVASDAALFDAIETQYGVDSSAVAAIWGMETNYGTFPLNYDAAETLANMAVEGRRRTYAEGELIALMKLLESGAVNRGDLLSGWAGAMGQTQFMPSTYLAYAIDFNGDGRKDVWNDKGDALGSAANYLSVSGYNHGQPWGIEVMTPTGFDFALADGQDRRMATWMTAGLSPIRGGAFETGSADYAELWLPAGATGPKFLLFGNFDVFKTYNRADSYALAVGLLSDAIAGQPGPIAPWPTDLRSLSVAEIKTLQASLNSLGFDAGPVDGIAGRGTRGALQRFQVSRGLVADGYPTEEMLTYVTGETSLVTSSLAGPG